MVFVSEFLAKIQKRHFLTEKMAFFTFDGDPSFSIAFLWSQNSGIGPNIQNLAKNLKLTCSDTVKFGTEGKKLKNSENSVISLFFLI